MLAALLASTCQQTKTQYKEFVHIDPFLQQIVLMSSKQHTDDDDESVEKENESAALQALHGTELQVLPHHI